MDVKRLIENNRIVAIMRGVDPAKAVPVAEALFRGGIRAIEVTFALDSAEKRRTTLESIADIKAALGEFMAVGAGTVTDTEQVYLAKDAGAQFIVSPNTDVDVIRATKENKLVSIPGAFTPTEILTAHKAGADFVKLFPADAVTPAYIKAVLAPLSGVSLLAVGGVNLDNMADFIRAGVVGFGIGTSIIDKKAVANADYAKLTHLAQRYCEEAKKA